MKNCHKATNMSSLTLRKNSNEDDPGSADEGRSSSPSVVSFRPRTGVGVSLSTIHGAEAVDGETAMTFANAAAVRRAFENAGVEIIEEHGGGPGARLRQALSGPSKRKPRA